MKAEASFWWLLKMWLSKLPVHARESLHLQPRGQGDAVLLDSGGPALAAGSLVGRAGCLLGVIDDQQSDDEVGVKRPHDRLDCPRQRRWFAPSAQGSGMEAWRTSSLASSRRPVGAVSSAGVIATVTRSMGVPAGRCRVRSSLIGSIQVRSRSSVSKASKGGVHAGEEVKCMNRLASTHQHRPRNLRANRPCAPISSLTTC